MLVLDGDDDDPEAIDDLIQKHRADPGNAWWAYRVFDAISGSHLDDMERARVALDCLALLAAVDPSWTLEKSMSNGPEGHAFGDLLARDPSMIDALQLPSTPTSSILRAALHLSVVQIFPDAGLGKTHFTRSWAELTSVPAAARHSRWNALALRASSVADYPSFVPLAKERAGAAEDFNLHFLLPDFIGLASVNKDWSSFDDWLQRYRALPEALAHGHGALTVANHVGLRAADEGRWDDVETAMNEVLRHAAGAEFIGNADTSALSKRLRAENKLLSLCDQFDELVEKRDWRELRKGDAPQ